MVLSHERAHVRQRDFLIHTLAGLHCALFWFNPFSWWLQRQLSELGEALSDCAAVEQAESRASYAETLLAFATRCRWPLAAVAMANSSNLTPRIERLLSDRGFEQILFREGAPALCCGRRGCVRVDRVDVDGSGACRARAPPRRVSAPAPVAPMHRPHPLRPPAVPAPVAPRRHRLRLTKLRCTMRRRTRRCPRDPY